MKIKKISWKQSQKCTKVNQIYNAREWSKVKMGHGGGDKMRDKRAEMERRKDNRYIFITLHLDYLTT